MSGGLSLLACSSLPMQAPHWFAISWVGRRPAEVECCQPNGGSRRGRLVGQTVIVPELVEPSIGARESFLDAARALRAEGWLPDFPVEEVEADFPAYVRRVTGPDEFWGVPVSTRWYLDGETYLGTVIFRHALTPELLVDGGHIGYHIAPRYRGRGYATGMLAQAIQYCRAELGIDSILVTCAVDNLPSRRVIEANGGVLENVVSGQRRYWIRVR